MIEEIRAGYPNQFENDLLEEIAQTARLMHFDAGEDLIMPGQYIKNMPLLLKGSIKILRPDNDGFELLLYHLEKGDTCAMTLSCCMGQKKSEIHAVTETAVKLLMVPIEKMEEWSRKYRSWRNFVFDSYHDRMMEMLESIDSIAFKNMDQRLEIYIKNKVKLLGSKHIFTTHQEIADDLHTSRVVISRLLKKMENNGGIQLHRNFIEVL
ncbi:MAG: Crp/Fnr family transcriptional regulator [Cytophagaceae bacterium]|nr:Crp/Fnr family transcriptional regulator [Cytophagaceae bacterium]